MVRKIAPLYECSTGVLGRILDKILVGLGGIIVELSVSKARNYVL